MPAPATGGGPSAAECIFFMLDAPAAAASSAPAGESNRAPGKLIMSSGCVDRVPAGAADEVARIWLHNGQN
ncbi:hypothetical protein HYALB_00000362 [Hymenoscyphus albidus]|uniref:Uncharacterized protein n=1 Tax=Hymenoscyphus albidus TaxID=595503 RepID=A0A9N9LNM5_9HELO|nr:hypothetical protein HYALB_00000362 [Hymenoscyphus albidus]